MKPLTAALLLLMISSCTSPVAPSANQGGWRLVYRNDKDGNGTYGNKQDLIKAVRHGYPVRVGWGSGPRPGRPGSVEHVADAYFLTIANEKEVFAQILPIIGQAPKLLSDTLSISYRTGNDWRRLFGTNGFTESLSYDVIADTLMGVNQRYVPITWYVNYPAAPLDEVMSPLWN